ncbi:MULTISPECIES: DarT ssDNA thymidine ADP-ribosyltransferase family protein [Bacillus cereus group]|uniref:DarT domain-containing protein n=1 Tax=Bacillus thuringiensis Bt18247 TaxID=1423143 RepID=A0A9W3SQC2_BACTU|nr:DarT ssDNA thymidine ADP-ribosyltransferase family protein [Bacillus thuringiensis]AOM09557.1 hypothetical protein BTI247_11470 [Bacillus thuringiensis Bt18247]
MNCSSPFCAVRNDEIREQIKLRNIEHLVHFTNAKNIKSIIKNGIIPVQLHSKYGINSLANDKIRSDDLTETTSFSIEFPNYKMFYKLRAENPNEEWAVLFVNSSILLNKECVFCFDNASNPEIKGIPLKDRMSVSMFKRMFEDIEGILTRSERKLKRYFTTLPQAEILIFGIIDSDYIDKIAFIDSKTKKKYTTFIPNSIKSEVIPDYFYAREDHEYEIE